jgi:hypothetical protein
LSNNGIAHRVRLTNLAVGWEDGASSPWRSRPLMRRAKVLSLAGVETEAEAAWPEGDPPPPPLVDAEWATPPEDIAAGIEPEFGGGGGDKEP